MRKPIVAIVFALVFTAALGLAGCGGSASSSSASVSGSSEASSSNAEEQGKAEYDRATALFEEGKYYSAKKAFEESGYGDWGQRAAACVQPMPETGELWHNTDLESDEMILSFDVNEQDSNTGWYISVYTEDKKPAATVFVKGSGTVETKLPGGNYYIKDAKGTEWYGEDELFGPDGHYENMIFDEVEGDRYLTALDAGYEWKITIQNADAQGQGVGSEETGWEDRNNQK